MGLGILARRRQSQVVFDDIEGGAEGEVTLRENYRAFEAISFRPRHHVVATSDCDLAPDLAGEDLSFPEILALVGYGRLMHLGGEIAAALPSLVTRWRMSEQLPSPVWRLGL